MIRIGIVIVVITFTFQLNAQGPENKRTLESKAFANLQGLAIKNATDEDGNMYLNVTGNPFYYDEEMPAVLTYHDGRTVEDVKLQVDCYAKEFIFTKDDGQRNYLDVDFYKEIKITNGTQTDVYQRVFEDQPRRLFLILYQDEQRKLIKIPEVRHVETSVVGTGGTQAISKFSREDLYDLVEGDKVTRLKFKKKKFYKTFDKDTASYLKKVAKEKSLSMKEESDYVVLIKSLAAFQPKNKS